MCFLRKLRPLGSSLVSNQKTKDSISGPRLLILPCNSLRASRSLQDSWCPLSPLCMAATTSQPDSQTAAASQSFEVCLVCPLPSIPWANKCLAELRKKSIGFRMQFFSEPVYFKPQVVYTKKEKKHAIFYKVLKPLVLPPTYLLIALNLPSLEFIFSICTIYNIVFVTCYVLVGLRFHLISGPHFKKLLKHSVPVFPHQYHS